MERKPFWNVFDFGIWWLMAEPTFNTNHQLTFRKWWQNSGVLRSSPHTPPICPHYLLCSTWTHNFHLWPLFNHPPIRKLSSLISTHYLPGLDLPLLSSSLQSVWSWNVTSPCSSYLLTYPWKSRSPSMRCHHLMRQRAVWNTSVQTRHGNSNCACNSNLCLELLPSVLLYPTVLQPISQ